MQHVEHGERRLDGCDTAVLEHRPRFLVVRLDRRGVFRQSPLESDVRVHVTVGHVVHDLPNGPTVGPVGRVELSIIETLNRGAHVGGRGGNGVDGGAAFRGREGVGALQAADRIPKIFHG